MTADDRGPAPRSRRLADWLRELPAGTPRVAASVVDFLEPVRGALVEPIASDALGPPALRERGRALAECHDAAVTRRDGGAALIARLRRNAQVLREAAAVLEHDIEPGVYASQAAQWLSDNLALIDEQLDDVTDSLPAGWFRDLPLLGSGPARGTPRVLDIAWAWLPASGLRFEPALLDAFFDGYQGRREPNWGEWWALPQVLRLVLVEHLRRLGERVAADKAARTLAHAIAAGPQPAPQVLGGVIAALTQRGAARAFLLQLHASSREVDSPPGAPSADAASHRWPDAALQPVVPPGGWEAHVAQPAVAQQAQQAADAACDADVAEAVRSLRAVSRFRWREWIESRSRLAATLRRLPAFAGEDDETQNRTLHALERWSRRTGRGELDIADVLVAQVSAAAGDPLASTPGHWLEGAGRHALAVGLGVPAAPPPAGPERWPRARLPLYLAAIALSTLLLVALALPPLARWPAGYGIVGVLGVLLLVLLPASEIAVSAWHRLLCEWLPPRRLARLAFDDGIPQPHRVLVVVPCLLGRDPAIDALAAQLERHHLASNEAWAQYALLSDFSDAPTEHSATDAAQLAHARQAVAELNARHAALPDAAPRFLLLHRQRVWSEEEGRWMGWERKRGKIEQLVSLLADPLTPPFAFVDLQALSRPAAGTPYIVVLDADTLLPPGSLRALASIAAHPANRPRVDPALRRVVDGHGVLQPRVALPLPTPGTSTLFHALTAGFSGLDPYSAAASEVYEDLFGEGSFSGKGLLHVQAAHAVLGGRLPQGQVLSHDLLEGALLRCAAVGDVALLEGAPVHPDVADSRLHRWTRGDWQLLPFIARPRHWSVTALNLWKMVDNLRRSLVAPASLALLLASAASGWPAPGVALLLVLGALGVGPLIGAAAAFAPGDDRLALRPLGRHALGVSLRALGAVAWQFAQLLSQSLLLLDAIARALFRHFVSRRHLLAWTTAAAAEAAASRDLALLWRRHRRISLAAALLAAGLVALPGPPSPMGLLLCLVWGLSPLWTWAAAQVLAAPAPRALPEAALADLHDIARETWRFFDRHVGAATHHLPPDNHQRVPNPQTAAATSPTNIGMYLLSVLSAWRFGFIGGRDAARRIAATLATLEALPRHRGHFYNWIDTRTLALLPPAYVSTVDSGNLCAALVAVAQGLREMAADAAEATAPAGTAGEAALARNAVHLAAARSQGLLAGLDSPMAAQTRLPRAPEAAAALVQATRAALATVQQRLAAFDEETTLDGAPPQAQESAWWRLADHLSMLHSLAQDLAPAVADDEAAHPQPLARRAEALAWAPQFGWLLDRERGLLHIGAVVAIDEAGAAAPSERLDASHYDLFASEARLASLLAIAKGDLPMTHWARLERATFAHGSRVGLQSWSGSMFEYLMPMLLVDEPEGSLLHAATEVAVREQRLLGRDWHLPWGVSESAHAERDASLAYQYGPQGAPRLALRRTPPAERVVAPYATLLAAQIVPMAAWRNLRRLARRGARDRYGFIEALDFTPARQQAGSSLRRVATFMAHHQGMSLVSLANVLLGGVARQWFMSHPRVRAVSPLLHEPVPGQVRPLRALPPLPEGSSRDGDRGDGGPALPARELLPGTHALEPVALLGNGRYSVLLHPDGSGASRWLGHAVTRWRDDALRRQHGSFFFMRCSADGDGERRSADAGGSARPRSTWCSLTHHPAPAADVEYRCEWQPHAASFSARASRWTAQTRVWVAPEEDVELRELSIDAAASDDGAALVVELASYFEVALAPQAADEAHPAFANLFVSARWDAAARVLWLQRRGRLEGDATVFAAHFIAAAEHGDGAAISFAATTDRAHAIGRGRSVESPQRSAQPEAADTGLDPVASISASTRLRPGSRLVLSFATAVAHDEATLQRAVERHRERSHGARAWRMATTLAAIGLREAGLGAAAWHAWQALSTPLAVWLSRPMHAAAPADVGPGANDRRALWRVGLSGERPLLLLRVPGAEGLPLAEWFARVVPLWARHGLAVDVVLLNTEPASYFQPVQQGLARLVERFAAAASRPLHSACHLLLLRADDLSALESSTLRRLARLDLRADGRALRAVVRDLRAWHAAELARRQAAPARRVPWLPAMAVPGPGGGGGAAIVDAAPDAAPDAALDATFDRATGACRFAVGPARRPLRPWTQVLANAGFGTQVTEAGGGHSWAHNSKQLQITPWRNDPLTDPAGEWLLLQDLDSGRVWNCYPAPWGAAAVRYEVEQGPGWTRVSHRSDGIAVELEVVVDEEHALKQTLLSLRNEDPSPGLRGRPRRLRVVAVATWQLGERWADRAAVATHLQWLHAEGPASALEQARDDDAPQAGLALHATQTDSGTGFGMATAFLALRPAAAQPRRAFDWTADRRELFDPRGTAVLPDALGGRAGLGLDPCAALSLPLLLQAGQGESVAVLLGHADSVAAARRLAAEAVAADPARRSSRSRGAWRERQSALSVHSPDPLFDVLVNHWLRYQALACRLWARAGYYQAGGAFGFRDQLQDAMALTDVDGGLLRQQIVLAASRQFAAGDVQHWWHPPHGAGVRTRFSDDLLWLVAAVLRHLDTGGSAALLEQPVPFLEGHEVPAGAEDIYETPRESEETATVWEHAARALDRSLAFGVHGLPLMGSGDWNDGMNRVGIEGRGESVWLAWFQLTLLAPMAALARQRGEAARAERWAARAVLLRQAVDGPGWDGAWYRRAFFDDGQALGSAANAECRIDLIAQAWAMFSAPAAGPVPPRAKQALQSAAALLFDDRAALLRLLHPPLQQQQPSAGYIQAYPPGVRENGGQYSHAAAWAAMAFAQAGDAASAWRAWRSVSPAHRHQLDAEPAANGRVRYGLEPYAVAGDVYADAPWPGRGGWSWYTGAAGWQYRAAVESLLGLQRQGSRVRFTPVLPPGWPAVCVTLRWAGLAHHFHLGPEAEAAAGTGAHALAGGAFIDLHGLAAAGSWFVVAAPGTSQRAATLHATA
jgi:cyclic beta-1,2-glucan synthetase